MAVNFSLLETAQECDTAIEILNAEKTQLERRVRNLGETLVDRQGRTVEVSEGIKASEAIITGFQAALTSIPEGKAKRDLELKIEREETKLKSLQNRQANYNAVSVIEDQVDEEQINVQIPVLDAAIAGVEAHKATL